MLEALILGIVQGLTEFIPVSSSGHLSILPRLFGWEENSDSFDVVLHAGTLIALLITQRFELKTIATHTIAKRDWQSLRNITIAILPSLIVGALLKLGEISFNGNLMIATTLSIGAFLMLLADKIAKSRERTNQTQATNALIVGLAQPLAFFRGTSRSGATIVAGVFSGLTLQESVRFSFLISIPIIAIACIVSFFDIFAQGNTEPAPQLILGFVSALISGVVAIKFVLKFTENRGLKWFAIYRLVLAFTIIITLVN